MKSNNTLWALCILLGALAFGVLFVLPRYLDEPAEPASLAENVPDDNAGSGVDADGEQPDEEVADSSTSGRTVEEPASQENASEGSAPDMTPSDSVSEPAADAVVETEDTVPAFDILRVEPDGSTVIAGRAAPGAVLDVMNGDDVVASTEVGPEGNFAAVFDEPLAPGDYQLSLRTTDERSNATTLSDEVATISIPENDESELLAMITRPGKASRIVAQPEAPAAEAEDEIAIAQPEPEAESGTEGDAATGEAPGQAAGETEIAAIDPDEPPTAEEADAAADTAPPVANEAPAENVAPSAGEAEVTVRIDAVEVEGDRLFVTGSASPGMGIQIYANEALVGASGTSSDGRFLVEGTMPLPVGENTIRADLLSQGRVVARAIVPFIRPEGEAAAAVAAAQEPAPAAAPQVAVNDTEAGADGSGEETVSPQRQEDLPTGVDEPDQEVAAADPTPEPADRIDSAASAESEQSQPPSSAPLANAPEVASSGGTQDAAGQADMSEPAEPTDEPVTIQQAALEPSDSSVIIRRGDTLWQISRRVYGQGVRYTTIYLANETQIADPDRILPGQVFSVPEEALDNAEELHRQRLSQ